MWFHGGDTIQKNPKVYISFWGAEWQNGFTSGGATNTQVISYVLNYFNGVGGSNWAGVNTQYCDNVPRGTFFCSTQPSPHFIGNPAGQLQAAFIDLNGVPATPNGLDRALAANRLRAAALGALNNNSDADFMVFLPPGHGDTLFVAKGGPACAWHSWFPWPFSPGVAYTTVPYQLDAPNNCGANRVNGTNDSFGHGLLDGFSIVAGHEYAEVVTDAFMDPVFNPPLFGGWMDNDGLKGETGDKCAWTMLDNVRIGSNYFAVQPLWSNNAGGCTTGSSRSISLSSNSLNFGNVQVGGASSTQVVTVTNPGTADLHISSVTYGGSNPGDFQDMGSDCASMTIHPVPSSFCTLRTRFVPTTAGPSTASISVSNDAGAPQLVNLQGFGVDSDLGLTGLPADMTVSATGPSGAVVTYTLPTAVDEPGDSPPPGVSCTPASGSTFPIGTTTVTCTATSADDTPSTVSQSFAVTVVDTDLGLAGVPANVTVNATSTSGAVVTYTAPTAIDEPDIPPATASCSPASGSTFPIGTTTVTCTATSADDTPSTVSQTFTVTVNDTDLGITGIPANITTDVTNPFGAVVTFATPTAIDETGDVPAPTVSCTPASGSTFVLGTTTVVCTATSADDTPSAVSGSFTVTVVAGTAGITNVVNQLLAAGCIDNAGIANALIAKLTAAQNAIAAGNFAEAINILNAFIHQVQAQDGKHIHATCTLNGVTFSPAAALIADAQSLINSLMAMAAPRAITRGNLML